MNKNGIAVDYNKGFVAVRVVCGSKYRHVWPIYCKLSPEIKKMIGTVLKKGLNILALYELVSEFNKPTYIQLNTFFLTRTIQ